MRTLAPSFTLESTVSTIIPCTISVPRTVFALFVSILVYWNITAAFFSIQAHLTVIPCQTGQLCITGIKYSLTSVAINGPVDEKFSIPAGAASAMTAVSMLGRLDLVLKGPRLNNTKAEKTSVVHGLDNRLNLDVVPPMPLLEVMSLCLQLSWK